jgi:hypothetical protein
LAPAVGDCPSIGDNRRSRQSVPSSRPPTSPGHAAEQARGTAQRRLPASAGRAVRPVPTAIHACPRKPSGHQRPGLPAGHGPHGRRAGTSPTTGPKTIMQEPLAHFPKIRHGKQSTHDFKSLLPVIELGVMYAHSMTQRERRIAVRPSAPRAPERCRRPQQRRAARAQRRAPPAFPEAGTRIAAGPAPATRRPAG